MDGAQNMKARQWLIFCKRTAQICSSSSTAFISCFSDHLFSVINELDSKIIIIAPCWTLQISNWWSELQNLITHQLETSLDFNPFSLPSFNIVDAMATHIFVQLIWLSWVPCRTRNLIWWHKAVAGHKFSIFKINTNYHQVPLEQQQQLFVLCVEA